MVNILLLQYIYGSLIISTHLSNEPLLGATLKFMLISKVIYVFEIYNTNIFSEKFHKIVEI